MKSKPSVKWARNYHGSVLMKQTMATKLEELRKLPLWYKRRSKRSPYRLGKMDFEEFFGNKRQSEEEPPRWKVIIL